MGKGENEIMGIDIGKTNKKYEIIYADPAWSYYNDSSAKPDCTTVKGVRRPPYRVMASKEIKNLPISQIVADDAIIFIWTTDYHLKRCIEVMEAWGFEYKTVGFAWQKLNKKGDPVCFTGAYTMKSGIELCLLGTRGKNARKKLLKAHNVRALVQSPRLEHSRKPKEVIQRIDELLSSDKKIELFARETNEGWDCWGNQIGFFEGKDGGE